jgi:hypothetical protein
MEARMNMKQRLLAIVVLATAMLAGGVRAQDRDAGGKSQLVGTVTDEAGRPLVGAFVAFEGSRWGALTGETGQFVLTGERPGDVTLTVELIGYETLTWSGRAEEGREIALTLVSKPILLEGLTVVADRFASRRRATPVSVRAFDRATLTTAPHANVLDFLRSRGGMSLMSCPGDGAATLCVWSRGRTVAPTVWVDETPVLGGIDYLVMFQPHELYMVEVYAAGRHLRIYTNHYMEQAANQRLFPIPFMY